MSETAIVPELLAQIRRIHLVARRLADSLTAGSYRSAFRGHGLEFDQVREYVPGDDVRAIDWKVTARLGWPFVKSYREERELSIVIACDVSASTQAALCRNSRATAIAHIGAFLALLARKGNDRVGLTFFSDHVEYYLPPRKVRSQAWRIVHELLAPRPASHATKLSSMAKFLSQTLKRRSVVYILSDFIDAGYERELLALAKRHEVVAVIVHDETDRELPNVGLLEVRDPETGERELIDTARMAGRVRYDGVLEQRRVDQRQGLRKMGVDVLEVRTDRPFVPVFRRYFEER